VVTRECYLSCMIPQGLDNSRFYQVKTNLQNNMTKGTNNFPKTVVQTTCLLSNYKVPPGHVPAQEPDSEGVQNLSIEDSVQEHSLFLTDNDYKMLQKEETSVRRWVNGWPQTSSRPFGYLAMPPMSTAAVKLQGQKGLRGILLPHHVYIDTCASYASTPYPHLLKNLKKEERALVGHSNMGLGGKLNRCG
jgi:hypothetical protein